MAIITATYLWLALHFHDVRWSWWIGLLAVFIDMLITSPLVKVNHIAKK